MGGDTGIRDVVTGLYVREYFDDVIARELERSRRHGIHLSVLSVVLANLAELSEALGADLGSAVVEAARAPGLLLNSPRPHCLRLMPALNTAAEEIGIGLSLLRGAIIAARQHAEPRQ
jgi:acetylornithine/succinyldiaminopimelate/putrescine aminotransferase